MFIYRNLQSTILTAACGAGYAPCLEGAVDRYFRPWIKNGDFIPPDFRTLVYRYGIAEMGDADVWNTMWDRFVKESDPSEAIKLLYGLAFPKEPWLIQQYYKFNLKNRFSYSY